MTRKNKMKLIRDISNKLEENGRYYSVSLAEDDIIEIEVSWGDWKHDHAFLNSFIQGYFSLKFIGEEVTEEDGSDCYSSIHYFNI